MIRRNSKTVVGFSLLEILLVVAAMVILAGFSIPVYLSYQSRNESSLAINLGASALHRAYLLASANVNDSSWGVKFNNGEILVFSGSDYLTRDPVYDEVAKINDNIVLAGPSEIVFFKFSGEPNILGIIELGLAGVGTKTIEILPRALINY